MLIEFSVGTGDHHFGEFGGPDHCSGCFCTKLLTSLLTALEGAWVSLLGGGGQ